MLTREVRGLNSADLYSQYLCSSRTQNNRSLTWTFKTLLTYLYMSVTLTVRPPMLSHFIHFVNLKNLENNTEAKKKGGVNQLSIMVEQIDF